jgi:hypothetical protein
MQVNLGQPISKHPGTFGAGGWLWYVAAVLIFGGVAALFRMGSPPPGQAALDMVVTGAVGIGVGGLLLLLPLARLRQSVEVFEHGFVWKRMFGTQVVPRSEITNVELLTVNRNMGAITKVTVTLRMGQSLCLAGLQNAQQLANFLGPAGVPAPAAAPVSGGWRPPGTY